MKLMKLLALCSMFALSACETTSFGGATSDSGPRKFPCSSITNGPQDYHNEPIQHREQLEAQPKAMC